MGETYFAYSFLVYLHFTQRESDFPAVVRTQCMAQSRPERELWKYPGAYMHVSMHMNLQALLLTISHVWSTVWSWLGRNNHCLSAYNMERDDVYSCTCAARGYCVTLK